jgi:phage terminase large subunit
LNKKLRSIVGDGYDEYWDFKGRYRVCKGSRASKKSKTTALNLIYRLMHYRGANILVVRKVYATLKDSCYAELKWAIRALNVEDKFDCKLSPLEIIYKETGQKIFFRGLDAPLKITSITVESGSLCWLWLEEAYEVDDEESFNLINESIRGEVGEGLFKQVTITFNPWNERHWLKKRFFEREDEDILAITTTYLCNEWLDAADIKLFEEMKANNPTRYRVAGLGEWGVAEGLIYQNWTEWEFDVNELRQMENVRSAFGLDFGYVNDPTALFCGLVDCEARIIWVFDELYRRGMTNEAIAEEIKAMGYGKEIIRADCAEPKSIDRLRGLGLYRVKPCRKGRDSIMNGIDFISDFKLIVHPRCVNFIAELSGYCWEKDRYGNCINVPISGSDHLMDAMRYAVEDMSRKGSFSILR